MVFDAYIGDPAVRGFLAEHNPEALKDVADRLREAQERGLWRPRRNRAYDELAALGRSGAGAAGREDAP